MDKLYAVAIGTQVGSRSDDAREAVRNLADYRGERSTGLLIDIALGHGPIVFPEVRNEAIKALSRRNDRRAMDVIAILLQPHQGLDNRESVAAALEQAPCDIECISSVLHYLERIYRGEPNYEDRLVFAKGTDDEKAEMRTMQERVYHSLYLVLQRNETETLTVLSTVYGLGSVDPSTFAFDLASKSQLRGACPLLKQSEDLLKDGEFYNGPTKELDAAITSLNCK
jgi:hypothetical protein